MDARVLTAAKLATKLVEPAHASAPPSAPPRAMPPRPTAQQMHFDPVEREDEQPRTELADLRARYEAATGEKPDMRWGAARLREALAATSSPAKD